MKTRWFHKKIKILWPMTFSWISWRSSRVFLMVFNLGNNNFCALLIFLGGKKYWTSRVQNSSWLHFLRIHFCYGLRTFLLLSWALSLRVWRRILLDERNQWSLQSTPIEEIIFIIFMLPQDTSPVKKLESALHCISIMKSLLIKMYAYTCYKIRFIFEHFPPGGTMPTSECECAKQTRVNNSFCDIT